MIRFFGIYFYIICITANTDKRFIHSHVKLINIKRMTRPPYFSFIDGVNIPVTVKAICILIKTSNPKCQIIIHVSSNI